MASRLLLRHRWPVARRCVVSAATHRQQGFTLIELIMVIVVLGILSFGSTQFIVNSTQSYMDTARRERQGSAARTAVEKMSRELRAALPNSVRVADIDADGDADCIEFVPALGGSIYTSLPLASASTGFTSIPYVSGGAPSIDPLSARVAVYPLDSADIYTLTTSSALSSRVDAGTVLEGAAEVAVLLQAAHQFPFGSPGQRWYLVSDPVSFCFDAAGKLFRYADYGYSASQPVPGAAVLIESVPQRSLLAVGASGRFNVIPATLQRNALVQLTLDVRERGEGVSISHEVQLRNVP